MTDAATPHYRPMAQWGQEHLAAAALVGETLNALMATPGWARLERSIESECAGLMGQALSLSQEELAARRVEADGCRFLVEFAKSLAAWGRAARVEIDARARSGQQVAHGRPAYAVAEGLSHAALLGLGQAAQEWETLDTGGWAILMAMVGGAWRAFEYILKAGQCSPAHIQAVCNRTNAALRRVDREIALGRSAAGQLAQQGG